MSQAFSGTYANVVVGSLDMDASEWNLTPKVGDFDSTTTADAGWDDSSPSTKSAEGDFTFFYNAAKKPTGAGASLSPGSVVQLALYPNKESMPSDSFSGSALITQLSLKSKVKDGFAVTASFKSKGAWTYPS